MMVLSQSKLQQSAEGDMKGGVTVLGVFVADVVFRSSRMPRLGETLLGSGFSLGPGGKGSNQAVAAGRVGGTASLLTKIGSDSFGDLAHRVWKDAGVKPMLRVANGVGTGAAGIFVLEEGGENAIVVCSGASGTISDADVQAWRASIETAAVFLTQLEQPLPPTVRALEIAAASGVRTVLNPAPAADLPTGSLALCDFLTPNETEAEALTGLPCTGPEDAELCARHLQYRGASAVVVTLGDRGALYRGPNRTEHVPAFRVGSVVDTTGAGDAFNGAFAVALAEGQDEVAAVRFGCAAAGLAVTRPGTAVSMPDRKEVAALLA